MAIVKSRRVCTSPGRVTWTSRTAGFPDAWCASMSNDNTPLSGVQEVLTSLPDLASERIGGRAIAASDDFFAPRRNLVKASEPVFVPDRFTSRGKWMDGWESRRRRTPGHDW